MTVTGFSAGRERGRQRCDSPGQTVEWRTRGLQRVVPTPNRWTSLSRWTGRPAFSLTLVLDDGATATLISDPPHPAGPKTVPAAPGGGTVEVDGLRGVSVTGAGVGVSAVQASRPFPPLPPSGDLRIAGMALPDVQPNDHHVTLVAVAPVGSLSGWTLRWTDAVTPGDPVLYAELPDVALGDGERLRLFPGLSQVPPATDVPSYAGGPGEDPPAHGVVLQLVDPTGTVAHETAAMPPPSGSPVRVVGVEDHDGTRNLLLPATGAGFPAGWWTLTRDRPFGRRPGRSHLDVRRGAREPDRRPGVPPSVISPQRQVR